MAIVYFVPTDFARGRVVVVNAVPVLYIVKKWLTDWVWTCSGRKGGPGVVYIVKKWLEEVLLEK